MVVVVLLAVRAMERCLFVLWLLSFLCFDRFISLQVVCGSDFVRVLRPSFEFRSTWLRGSSYDTTPLCCSLSASVSVDSSSGGVGPPRSERGLHALARVGNVPLFRPSGWCFSGWSAGAGEARVRRVVFHTLVRVVPPSGLAILFMCFSVYSSFLSQFAIVVG
jgi:hypothetical protein